MISSSTNRPLPIVLADFSNKNSYYTTSNQTASVTNILKTNYSISLYTTNDINGSEFNYKQTEISSIPSIFGNQISNDEKIIIENKDISERKILYLNNSNNLKITDSNINKKFKQIHVCFSPNDVWNKTLLVYYSNYNLQNFIAGLNQTSSSRFEELWIQKNKFYNSFNIQFAKINQFLRALQNIDTGIIQIIKKSIPVTVDGFVGVEIENTLLDMPKIQNQYDCHIYSYDYNTNININKDKKLVSSLIDYDINIQIVNSILGFCDKFNGIINNFSGNIKGEILFYESKFDLFNFISCFKKRKQEKQYKAVSDIWKNNIDNLLAQSYNSVIFNNKNKIFNQKDLFENNGTCSLDNKPLIEKRYYTQFTPYIDYNQKSNLTIN